MTDVSVVAPDNQAAVEANELAAAQELYDELKPQAELQGRNYIVARMPPAKAALVQDQIDADFPAPAADPAPPAEPTP